MCRRNLTESCGWGLHNIARIIRCICLADGEAGCRSGRGRSATGYVTLLTPCSGRSELGSPTTVEAQAKGYDPKKHADTFPGGTVVRFEFPAKGKRGPVTLIWFDGSERPPQPQDLEPERKAPGTEAIVMGDKGTIMYGSHGASEVRIIPETKMKEYKLPVKTLPRVKGHYEDWLEAIKNKTQAGSNFDYGGPLTELAQLGIIATKMLGQNPRQNHSGAEYAICQ